MVRLKIFNIIGLLAFAALLFFGLTYLRDSMAKQPVGSPQDVAMPQDTIEQPIPSLEIDSVARGINQIGAEPAAGIPAFDFLGLDESTFK